MSPSERYRTLSEDAARAAAQAAAPQERSAWRDIAESWAKLAREAEALERSAAKDDPAGD